MGVDSYSRVGRSRYWPAHKENKSMQTRENCVKSWPIFSYNTEFNGSPSHLAAHCLWFGGCADGLLNASPKLGSHQSLCVCLAGEPGLVMWSVVPLLRPSIHPRQVPMTQDAMPAVRLDKRVYRSMLCGHAEKECAHRHTCAPNPSLVSRCASITPQHLVYMSSLPCGPCSIKSDDWLSVGIKRNPILVFSPGTSLEGYWLIHHSVNMDFFSF